MTKQEDHSEDPQPVGDRIDDRADDPQSGIGDQAEEWLATDPQIEDCELRAEGEAGAPTPEDGDSGEPSAPEADPLQQAQDRIAELEDQLARAKAECYNVSQEYAGYVRRAKAEAPAHRAAGQAEVLEALIPALDDVHAARVHGQLDENGPFGQIVKKIMDALGHKMGLEMYGVEGEAFDPKIHEALMAQDSDQVSEPVIAQVAQPGYRVGERTVRPARVIVHNPA